MRNLSDSNTACKAIFRSSASLSDSTVTFASECQLMGSSVCWSSPLGNGLIHFDRKAPSVMHFLISEAANTDINGV